MKVKDILRATTFVVVFCILFMVCERELFNKNEVSSVWSKLDDTEIDVLIMGNSHVFTSLDAKVLSDATGLDIELLGSPAQYSEQTLENLKVVLQYQQPKYIILEMNCFYGDTRDQMKNDFRGLMIQNTDGIEDYRYKLESVYRTYGTEDIFTNTFQIFRSVDMWKRWENFEERDNCIENANGYQAKEGLATVLMDLGALKDEYSQHHEAGTAIPLEDYNESALREMLQLAEENDIEVWMYKGPTTKAEYAECGLAIEEICKDYPNVAYIDDMHLSLTSIGLGTEDWYDWEHLNRQGAEKVTRYYAEMMAERLGVSLHWDEVFAYRTEDVQPAENGTYLYAMKNYSEQCLYQYELYVDGKLEDVQKYSPDNIYECTYDIRNSESCELYCSMIPAEDAALGDESESRIYLPFMKYNTCVIE